MAVQIRNGHESEGYLVLFYLRTWHVPPPFLEAAPRRVTGFLLDHYAFAAEPLAGGGTYPPIGSTSLLNAPLMMIAASRYHAVAAQTKLS